MLATDAPRQVFALMVATWLASAASAAALFLFLAAGLVFRKDLLAGFRALVARVRAAGAPVTTAA